MVCVRFAVALSLCAGILAGPTYSRRRRESVSCGNVRQGKWGNPSSVISSDASNEPTDSAMSSTYVAPSSPSNESTSRETEETPVSTEASPAVNPTAIEAPKITAGENTEASISTAPLTNGGSTSQADIDEYLSNHNDVRSQHGASVLTWNNDLASAAQEWADRCVFEHSGGKVGSFGENLAAGTGDYPIASGIKAWADEVTDYDSSNPQPSHFTQMVWKATAEIGCAVSSCTGIFEGFGASNFYVCEYSPAGNVIGQFAENVQA